MIDLTYTMNWNRSIIHPIIFCSDHRQDPPKFHYNTYIKFEHLLRLLPDGLLPFLQFIPFALNFLNESNILQFPAAVTNPSIAFPDILEQFPHKIQYLIHASNDNILSILIVTYSGQLHYFQIHLPYLLGYQVCYYLWELYWCYYVVIV